MTSSTQTTKKALLPEAIRRRAALILVYLTGQGLVQLSMQVIGLLLLRWLSVVDYAQFSIAFSFQSTFGMLTDLGITATITALVGPRIDQPKVIGSFIRSGLHVRNMMLVVLTPIALVLYLYIAHLHHWGLGTTLMLFLSCIGSIYVSGIISCFTAPLLMHRRLTRYYRAQVMNAFSRATLVGLLHVLRGLYAWTTGWTNVFGLAVQAFLIRRQAGGLVELPKRPSKETTRLMVRYAMPNMPSLIFYALQGQISIYLISIFGNTQNIAEVGALGRLAQMFLILNSFNGTVIEPYMARLPKERVARSFVMILGAALGICVAICLVGFVWPGILLWLLGPHYGSLRAEVGWLLVGGCFTYLVGVVWYMTTARRWVYWSTSWVTIGMIVAAQIVYLSVVHIDSTMHAILFTVISTGAHFLSMLVNAIVGFIRGPRVKIEDEPGPHAEPEIEGESPEILLLDDELNSDAKMDAAKAEENKN